MPGTDKLVMFPNIRNRWQWKWIAPNGETLSVSEEYSDRTACRDTVVAAKKRHPGFEIVEPD